MSSVTDVFIGSGKHTLNDGTGGCWHVLSSTGSNYEGLLASVQIRCTRDTDSTTITIHDGWISSSLYNPYSASYGYPITWGLVRGGTITTSHNASDTDNYCVVGGTPILSEQLSSTGGGTRSFDPNDPSTHLTFTSSTNETLRLCFLCGQSGGCQQGYSGSSGSPYSEWVVIADIDTSRIPYNPHLAPSISLNSYKNSGAYYKTNDFWVKYNVTKGTNNLKYTLLEILDSNDSVLVGWWDLSLDTSSEHQYNYSLTADAFKNGGTFKVRLGVVAVNSQDQWTDVAYSSIGTITVSGYVAATISLNSNKDLGVYNKNNDYWVKYTITKGSYNISSVGLEVYNSSKNTKLKTYTNLSKTVSTEQTYNYTLNGNNQLTHGMAYAIRVYVYDGANYRYSSWSTIHTCHYPSVSGLNLWTNGSSSATQITVFSPQNTAAEFWWTQDSNNSYLWTGENAETNELYTMTGDTKHSLNPGNNNRSIAMTTSNINTLFPTSERNVNSLTKTVTIARTHNQIPVTVTATKSITLQLQPTKTPNSFKILNANGQDITSTVQNKLILKTDYPTIKLQWSYPYTDFGAGVISGYRIQIFTDSSYTQQFGSNIDVDTTAYNNVQYTLDVITKLKSLVMNYVKITPYYKDGNNTKRLGTNALTAVLFAPYGAISKPVIDYPINNMSWHNKNFRVLFTLPEDDDYDSSQASTYRYPDIDVKILQKTNDSSMLTHCYYQAYPEAYSTSTLSYRKAIVVNPSLMGNISNYNQYELQVRVAKTVNGELVWSEYSNKVTLNRVELEPLESGGEDYIEIYNELNEILGTSDSYTSPGDTNINIYNELNSILSESDSYSGGGTGVITIGGIIRAAHYNTIRDYSLQLHAVYPITALNQDNVSVSVGNKILHDYYQGIYNTILKIQREVNNYATFDNNRNNVKFNQTINLLSGQDAAISGEIITADRDLRPGSGRDYLLLLYDSMSLLY